MSTIRTYEDATQLANGAAEHIVSLAREAIAQRGRFSIALSGGTTPKLLYARLAEVDIASQVDWSHVYVFWGDERAVPPDHADSNYRMACEQLLNHVFVPEHNVYRMSGEEVPLAAASEYEELLRTFFSSDTPEGAPPLARFDLILLGLGMDGHTASLFPGSPLLVENERWVKADHVDKLNMWRLSLTAVAINQARNVMFLVSGKDKAARLRQVLYGLYKPNLVPAQLIRPQQGRLFFMIDKDAAGEL